MKNEPNIGQLITDEASRDAIHIAVAPVVAAQDFIQPGQIISLKPNGEGYVSYESPVGIADPFLKGSIRKGERFWLFLYPKTITSLRHEWTHPAFLVLDATDNLQPTAAPNTKESEAWLQEFATSVDLSYDEVLMAGYLGQNENYFTQQGSTSAQSAFYGDEGKLNSFWLHWSIVTGRTPRHPDHQPFSCSC